MAEFSIPVMFRLYGTRFTSGYGGTFPYPVPVEKVLPFIVPVNKDICYLTLIRRPKNHDIIAACHVKPRTPMEVLREIEAPNTPPNLFCHVILTI